MGWFTVTLPFYKTNAPTPKGERINMIYQNKRRAFHKGIKAGKTPAEIAQEHNLYEFDVVQTLRHPIPKIAGASYQHLKVAVRTKNEQDERQRGVLTLVRKNKKSLKGEKMNMFNGTLKELAKSIPDHEVRGKLNGESFDFELIEYGERDPIYYLSKTYFGGRQEMARWVQVLPDTWESREIPQRWDWTD